MIYSLNKRGEFVSGSGKILGFEKILDPNEQVIWNGKPNKKKFLLSSLWGIPFALFFLALSLIWIVGGAPVLESPLVITIPVAIFLIVVPPIWQYRKTPHTEYMITNQRLLIKSGITKDDIWFTELDNIKDVMVKIGLIDKIQGTVKIYPITSAYPYEPKGYSFTEAGMNNPIKVYNIAEQKYEEITEIELYRKLKNHPKLEALTEPYAVAKLLKEAIFGA